MNKRTWIVAAACVVAGAPAVAQRVGDPIFTITVTAPRLVRQEVGRTNSGAPVEMISLTRRVDYKDLDLKQHASVAELETRVNEVAKEACDQLARVYPLSDPQTPDCVKAAVDKAMAQVRDAVAAANK
jgi:UrcA family protein